METNELFDIWGSGNEKMFRDKKMEPDMIEKNIKKRSLKNIRSVYFNIVFFFFYMLANIILVSANIPGYKDNRTIFYVLIFMLILCIGFLLFGIYLFYKFREINKFSDTLINLINKQLKYFKTSYELWLIIIALSTLILIFNIGIMVDYSGGQYRINHIDVFIIVNIAVFFFIYGTQKIATAFYIRTLKANLHDLKNGILEKSLRLDKRRKKYLWIWVVIFIILTITFIGGLLVF